MASFEISASICASLNDRLQKLGVKDVAALIMTDLQEGKPSQSLLKWLNGLLRELSKLNSKVHFTKPCTSIDQVMDTLKDDPPYFDKHTKNFKYKLASHLCSQIQTERLIRHNESATAMDVDTGDNQDSSVAFQLGKLCKVLNARGCSDMAGPGAAAAAAMGRLQEIRTTHPELLDTDLPHIIATPPVLNAQQAAKVAAVEEMLYKDFELRRIMLMKRMQVTVESFLWSQKAECQASEGSIRAAVSAQQRHLTRAPMRYELRHAVEANVTLLQEQSKRVTADANQYASSTTTTAGASGAAAAAAAAAGAAGAAQGASTKSIAKQILVGEVPDRGGRADEVRSKQLKEDVRRSFGGNRGGGGGGGGGGGNRRHEDSGKDSKKSSVPASAPVASSSAATATKAHPTAGKGRGGNDGGNNGGGGQQPGGGNKGKSTVADSAAGAQQSKTAPPGGGNPKGGGSSSGGGAGSRGGGGSGGAGNSSGGKARSAPASKGQTGGGAPTAPSAAKITTIVGASSGGGSGRVVTMSVQEAVPVPTAPARVSAGAPAGASGGLPPPPSPHQGRKRHRNNK